MKLTKKKAKELSILKWECIVKNNGSAVGVNKAHPELNKFVSSCAYCEWDSQKSKTNKSHISCMECPIGGEDFEQSDGDWGEDMEDEGCNHSCHPWAAWVNIKTKKNAQAVLTLIKQS